MSSDVIYGLPPEHASCTAREERSVLVVDPSSYSLPYDYSLCENLRRAGWDVTLQRSKFLHGEFEFPCTFRVREDFYRLTHRLPGRRIAWKLAKGAEHVLSTQHLLNLVMRERPDIVHYQWLMVPAVDGYFLRRLSRLAPVVLTVHNTSFFHNIPSSRLQGVGFRSVFRHVDAVIVHSEYSKRVVVEKAWTTADKVHVIPHGVLDHYASGEEAQAEEIGDKVVLFFGAIAPYKGLDLLLKAFSQLPRDLRQTTRVVVAGRPDMEMQPIRDLVAQLGIGSRIEWHLRFVEQREIAPLFRRATIVALPYREIDQSGVLSTAIAFGKPIVASRVGGFVETIEHGREGLLVEPENLNALAGALQSLLSSPEMRASMQDALRDLRQSKLSWSNIAQQTTAVYERLLRDRTGVFASLPSVAAV